MGRSAEDRLLEAMQGRVRPLHEDADVVAEVGASMQRISRRIRRKLVEGSTALWTGPGADEARAAFLALAAETEARGRTFEEAAKPMREAARAITRSREAYDTLPDPSGVRANPGLVGDGGFQDRESMDAWVQAQRAALAQEREKESTRHYRQYSASMTAAAADLARTLPDARPSPQPVDTSVTPWSAGGYTPPPADGWRPGVVGGAPDGSTGGTLVGTTGVGGTTDVGWGGTGDAVPDLSLGDDDDGTGSRPDDGSGRADDADGRSGLATGLGIGAGVVAVGAVGLGVGMARGRADRQTPGGLLASAAGARGDGRGAGGRTDGGRRAATGPTGSGGAGSAGGRGGRGGRGGLVPVTGMAGPPPRDGGGRGGRSVPVTGAVGRDERGEAPGADHWAVEDDWFGEDEAGPSVLR